MLVALTGATGFVGGAIARRLQGSGRKLRLLVRSPSRLPQDLDAEVLTGDVLDASSLNALVAGVDAVVHCAGLTRAAVAEQFEAVNAASTLRLAHRVVAQGQAPLLLISSLAARSPQLSAYARSKRNAEEALRRTPGLRWAALRAPAVYGRGGKEVLAMLRWMGRGFAFVPGAADARFSLVHEDDLAAAVDSWLDHMDFTGAFDIDDQQPDGYSWTELVSLAAEVFGRRIRVVQLPAMLLDIPAAVNQAWARWWGTAPALTPDKLRQLRFPDWVCDDQRFAEQTGWRPVIDLRRGLEDLKALVT
jgi:nucleoside-diphosphate-sugar epimerase